jgi:hypothetical protein
MVTMSSSYSLSNVLLEPPPPPVVVKLHDEDDDDEAALVASLAEIPPPPPPTPPFVLIFISLLELTSLCMNKLTASFLVIFKFFNLFASIEIEMTILIQKPKMSILSLRRHGDCGGDFNVEFIFKNIIKIPTGTHF